MQPMYAFISSCSNCRYYRELKEDAEVEVDSNVHDADAAEYGRCVRFPPALFHRNLLNGEFPVVHQDTWCGEYMRDTRQ